MSQQEPTTQLTPAQRRELTHARRCADAGIGYYNVSSSGRRLLRKIAAMGYLERRPNEWETYDITAAGRAALEGAK